ncbi:hypothetical protein DUP93_13690 [Salmonella enterica subsp. enterica serovar Toulon]|nr:hypothetical protein [Salmonella enterica subsp. enterica serovar Toulon]
MSKYFCPLFLDNGLYPGRVQIHLHLFLTASLHLTLPAYRKPRVTIDRFLGFVYVIVISHPIP